MTANALLTSHLDVEDLTVRYRRHTALDRLDLGLGPGVHAVLGPNGAGKTTLMRVLATVAAPTSGRAAVLGHDITAGRSLRHLRRRLGYLPQTFGYYPRFTVREFVEYFAWLKELQADDVPIAVDRALARVDLLERAGSRLKHLSGGMLRRVGIAQAIVNDPDVLLLDEPTAGLDPEQRVAFRALLRALGVDACVVVSTHLVEDVAAACSDVVVLASGRLAFQGRPEELARLGEDGQLPGDTATERGYTFVLRRHRGER